MKKRYVLKKWVKVVLAILGSIAFMLMMYLMFRVTPKQEAMIKNCMEQGYSRMSCEKGLFGY